MSSLTYKLPLVLAPQPEGGFTITCPVLPELITEADTVAEVNASVADAVAAIIEAYEDLGKTLPEILRPLQGNSPIWLETIVSVDSELASA